ncbi:MAG: hypothetical protein ABIS01_08860, partial [Ferruginibacter sp.]
MIKNRLLLLIFLFLSHSLAAQDQSPVQFAFNKQTNGHGEYILTIKAMPARGIRLFSIHKLAGDLTVNTSINFDSSTIKYLKDTITETGALKTGTDPSLNNVLTYFYVDSVKWQQKISLSPGDSIRLKGRINYYYKKGESIESGEEPISIQFQYKKETPRDLVANSSGSLQAKSMWALLFAGIFAGLIGF